MNLKSSIWFLPVSVLCFSGLLWAVRVRLQDGTPVRVRLKADLSSARVQPGDRVDYEVAHAVLVQGVPVIPEGAVAWGAVQSVKKDKEIKFDIQGLRLPNLVEVKLRSVREKTKNPAKDQIKVGTESREGAVALGGSEFTAYIDEDIEVEAVSAQPVAAPSARPTTVATPAEVKAPAPAAAVQTPAVTTPAPTPQPTTPAPAPVAAPVAPPPAPTWQDVGATGERVTVECFSDPSGADILLDDDFVGNTPSILKVPAANHRLEIRLAGYKSFSLPLNLAMGRGIRTIRAMLEKKE